MKPRITCVATANCPVRDWTTHQLFREDEVGAKTIFGYFDHHSGDDCELCAWELRARVEEIANV